MAETIVNFQYDREWKKKEDGSYKWCSKNEDIRNIILDDAKSVKFSKFVETNILMLLLGDKG